MKATPIHFHILAIKQRVAYLPKRVPSYSWWNKIENRNAECIEYDDKDLAIISRGYLHTYTFSIFGFIYTLQKIMLVIWAKCTRTKIQTTLINKKALLSQRWPRDAPYVYLQAIYPNFVHAYGHYTMRGFW